MHGAEALGQVHPVQRQRCLHLSLHAVDQARRQHCHAIPVALAFAHDDFTARELDILHPKPQALEQAHAGAVEQAENQTFSTGNQSEHSVNFLTCEHDGEPGGAFGPSDAGEPGQLGLQHLTVEEQEGSERLVLRGCGHAPLDR